MAKPRLERRWRRTNPPGAGGLKKTGFRDVNLLIPMVELTGIAPVSDDTYYKLSTNVVSFGLNDIL